MQRTLGTGPRDEDRSLLGRLLDCHARIREMLALAAALPTPPRAPDEEIAECAARIRRYFTRALPMHVRDEEESLAPVLLPLDRAGVLPRMQAQHREHDALVSALVATAGRIADAPESFDAAAAAELSQAAAALSAAMLPHLEEEEIHLFPLVRELDAQVAERIVAEMQARRAEDGGGGRGRHRR